MSDRQEIEDLLNEKDARIAELEALREPYGKALLLLTRLREEMWPGDHKELIDAFFRKLK